MLTTLARRVAFESPHVRLMEEDVRHPDGVEGKYWIVEKPRFPIVAAIEDGEIWMVEQWRHPIRRRSWELPMGVAPGGDATPVEEAARIELREETGVRARQVTVIAELDVAPGLMRHTAYVCVATGLTEGPQELEHGEQGLIAARWPLERLRRAAADGTVRDGVTLSALACLMLKGVL
jgi:ADP-ribose pyrophosphatase